MLDDFHRLVGRLRARRLVRGAPAARRPARARHADRSALPLGTLRAHGQLLELRADELRFTAAEAAEFLNGRLGLGPRAGRRRPARRPHRGLARRHLPGRAVARGRRGPPRAGRGVRRHERARRRLPRHRGARRPPAGAAAVHAAHGGARAALRAALRRRAATRRARRRRSSRSRARTSSCCRSTTTAAGTASTTSSRSSCGPSSSGASRRSCPSCTARASAWHRASGTTDEAIHHAVAAGAFAAAGALIAETWVHYANAGRTASVLDWLGRMPDAVVDADPRLLLVEAWVSALRGREDAMRAAPPRRARSAASTPARCPTASPRSSRASPCSARRSAGATCRRSSPTATRSAALEGPDSPWRPVITWALGWAHLCNGDLERADALAGGDGADRAAGRPVDRRRRRDRRPLADRGPPRAAATTSVRLAEEAYAARRRGRAARRDRGRRGAHGARRRAGGRGAGRTRRCAALERGVFLRRLWGQPLDLADGLIELGVGAGPRARRRATFAEAAAVLARLPGPGRAPGPAGGAARRAAGARRRSPRPRRSASASSPSCGCSTAAAPSARSARELYLSFNTVHTHVKADLPQARRLLARRGARAGARARRSPR